MSKKIEKVLILQGGGSLGAFGCGVFKALAKSKQYGKLDIVAGTSIGGINASIIAGSKEDHPENALEQFWQQLAEQNNPPFMNLDCNKSVQKSNSDSFWPPEPWMDGSVLPCIIKLSGEYDR